VEAAHHPQASARPLCDCSIRVRLFLFEHAVHVVDSVILVLVEHERVSAGPPEVDEVVGRGALDPALPRLVDVLLLRPVASDSRIRERQAFRMSSVLPAGFSTSQVPVVGRVGESVRQYRRGWNKG
jgi:hypothetical protein